MDDGWVVESGQSGIPHEIRAAAAAAQATLAVKLAMLRELDEVFGDSSGPAVCEQWIENPPSSLGNRSGSHAGAADDQDSPPAHDLWALSATELLAGFRVGAFDPLEVLESCLQRMDNTANLGAFVTRTDDTAQAQAEAATRRWLTGEARPLEGVPFGVKDIINTAGVHTSAGSALLADHVPATNATVVSRLLEAGAVMVAKTTTPDFAFGDETSGSVVNPRSPLRWAGGSSSGSAAGLAAGQFPLALGSDTGGSIRVPSSYCGVSGLKPTFGRVPRDGVFGVSWTLDHTGPMARTVKDLALMMTAIAGPSRADPYSSSRPVPRYSSAIDATESLAGLRIGVAQGWLAADCSAPVTTATHAAAAELENLGATITTVELRNAELAGIIAWLITVVEFAAHHAANIGRIRDFTPSAAQRLAAGFCAGSCDYLRALRGRSLIQRDLEQAFRGIDVLLTSATPTPAPDPATFFDDGDRLWLDKVARTLLPFNVTGMPALVVPVAVDNGLPVAIQIVAPPHCDDLCLQVGALLQACAPTPLRSPVHPIAPA